MSKYLDTNFNTPGTMFHYWDHKGKLSRFSFKIFKRQCGVGDRGRNVSSVTNRGARHLNITVFILGIRGEAELYNKQNLYIAAGQLQWWCVVIN